MKKRVLALFIALVMVFSLLPATAFADTYSGTCGNNVSWSLNTSTGVLTISGTGSMTSHPWAKYRSSIKKAVVKSGVTGITIEAFFNCRSLTSITIPSSVTKIGDDAFFDCSSLTSITIPNSVTSIGDCVFSGCSSLTSITIPNGVTSIGVQTFIDCTSLTSITIPSSVTSIGDDAFFGCSSLTSITIPNGVTKIGASAFYDCSSLTSITIPSSVTKIGAYAFNGCSSLTSVSVLSNNTAYSSSDGVLFNKNKTKLICFPAGKSASTYSIPSSVTSIGDYAFYDCISLTSVTIPSSVTSIECGAFKYCSSLTSITIPSGVTSISYCAFSDCNNLTSVTIPSSVTKIDDHAFYDCSSLKSITIPNSVTSIGDYAFYDCSSLTSITIPNGVTKIGDGAFFNCSSLTSITIPSSITKIGDGAFLYCIILTDVYFMGSASEWSNITIGSSNNWLTGATIHYHNHNYQVAGTTAPTYTSKGYTTYKCHECGKEYKDDFIPMLTLSEPVVTATKTASSVNLTWKAVEGATGYIIQRKTATGTTWADYAKTDGLSYTNSGITSGYAYSYRVVAYAGSVDTNSSVSTANTLYVGQVTGLTLTKKTNGVTVSWKKLGNASGYKVYRKLTSGDWKLIKTVTSGSTLSYTDTTASNTKRNYYKVVAYRTISGTTYLSTESASKNLIYIAAPSISSATNSASGKITVKWTKNASATGYRIKVVGTKTSSTFTVTSPSTLSKVITGRSKGTYKVYVQAYKTISGTKYYSEWSSYKTVKVTK